MAITPADIEKKTFSTALRGYDLDEVDDFLDEMVVAVRGLEEELAAARQRVAELEGDPPSVVAADEAAAPVAAGPDESAVGRALVAAQQAADRMLEEARGEADRIVADARTEADTFAQERQAKKAAVDAEMTQMTELVAGVRTKLAVLATTVADKLDEMDAAVAGAQGQAPAEPEATTGEIEAAESVENEVDHQGEGTVEGKALADAGSAGAEDDGPLEHRGQDTGLEVDLDESREAVDDEYAGSAEIEGVDDAEREGEGQET
ncbi:MAG TPA: DivIVA domain-containing protein [Acidimicrobiia bacterium]|nr:DivIVA domain-containing protein [Acidimicrobiia bacterium]